MIPVYTKLATVKSRGNGVYLFVFMNLLLLLLQSL